MTEATNIGCSPFHLSLLSNNDEVILKNDHDSVSLSQDFCSPTGLGYYENYKKTVSCLVSCEGLYADVQMITKAMEPEKKKGELGVGYDTEGQHDIYEMKILDFFWHLTKNCGTCGTSGCSYLASCGICSI